MADIESGTSLNATFGRGDLMEALFRTSIPANNLYYFRSNAVSTPGRSAWQGGAVKLPSAAVKSFRTAVYTSGGSLEPIAGESGTLLDSYRQIRITVQEQVAALSRYISGSPGSDSPVTPESNSMLEIAGPATYTMDLLADYWNRENMARRIFAIIMMGYQEGLDKADFVEQASSMITEAYGNIRATRSGEFTQLVLDARQSVLDALEQFRNGKAPSEISF